MFGMLSLFPISSKGVLEDIVLSEVDLTCPHVLQNSSPDFKSMFLQVRLIANKVEVTSVNRSVLEDIRKRLSNSSHLDDQRIEIETLLTIFYFFHTLPSAALASPNLYMYMDFDRLKLRSYPPEENIRQLLIIINRHLRSYIKELQSKFATGLNRPGFSIEDLAKEIHVPYQILHNVLNTDFVPDYLQMTQILNRGYSTIVTFFKRVEYSQEFKLIFGSYHLKTRKKRLLMII